MALSKLKSEISDEVSVILGPSFSINVTRTQQVPHSDDAAITFPNLDDEVQNVKLLESCVLYVDMRRSTELSLKHRSTTVAKLYSSFVRAMTRCASEYGGEVRGIIGDRVMMIFEAKNCYTNAVDTAILINSVCKYVLNKHFAHNELSFGIGIDYGRMLATKTGIRKHGLAQPSYRSLVWLGRPANVASKLTDQANKPEKSMMLDTLQVAYHKSLLGIGTDFSWNWRTEYPTSFVKNLEVSLGKITHKDPWFASFIHSQERYVERSATPPILMTKSVFDGFKASNPDRPSIKKGWFAKTNFKIDDYDGDIYGGDVIKTIFRDEAM
jgi:adenylate cyclase